MRPSTALTALVALIASTSPAISQSPSAPSCQPNDVPCLITSAQYTILGTVISNNAQTPPASAQDYNATIQIQCVYASAGTNRGPGTGMTGSQVLVTGFGTPNAKCPNGLGADAAVNTSSIYWISIASATSGPSQLPTYSVFNPCGGGIPFSQNAVQTLASVLGKNQQIALPLSGNCSLPTPVATSTTSAPAPSGTSKAPLEVPNSGTALQLTTFGGAIAAGVAGVLALA